MGSPFDQTLGWMPGMIPPPWGDSPAPAGPYPVPAPVDIAPLDQGAPSSVQGGPFTVTPWGHRPVPDLAGAVAAGADIAAQAQAVQPEMMPAEPVPGEIWVTPAESDANQLKFNPSAAPKPDSVGLVDPYPVSGQPALAPQPDSIGLIDPYPSRGPVPMPTMADYEAQQFRLHGAPPEPVNVGGSAAGAQPIDPYPAPPFDIAGGLTQWGKARGIIDQTDEVSGVTFKDSPYGSTAEQNAAELATKAPLDPYDPGAIDNRREAMAQAYANATPEERAAMDAREAAIYATKRQTMEMQQAEADRKAVEDNARIAKQAREKAARDMAQLQADVQGMADSSPFEAWWSDRSTLGKLGGVVSAIFSGLANPTGPNGAIEMMMRTADADAAQKWKKIEARRQLLGEQRAANADDATEREKIRLASREQAIRMIEAQMNGLDPEGTQALALGHTIAGLRAQDAQALQAWQAAQEKSALDTAKHNLEVFKANDAHDQWAAADERARARERRIGMGGGAKPAGILDSKAVYPASTWARLIPGLNVSTIDPNQNLSTADVKTLMDLQGRAGQSAIDTSRRADVDQNVEFGKKQLVLNDPTTGDPITGDVDSSIVYNKSLKDDLDKMMPAAADVLTYIDNTRRLIKQHGGEADFLKSDAWQQAKSNRSFLTPGIGKLMEGGAIDQGLIDLVDGMLGATDPTSYLYNAEAGYKQARANVLTKINHKISMAGIKKPWTVPDAGDVPFGTKNEAIDALSARGSRKLNPMDPVQRSAIGKLQAALEADKAGAAAAMKEGVDGLKRLGLTEAEAESMGTLTPEQERGRKKAVAAIEGGDEAMARALAAAIGNDQLGTAQRRAAWESLKKLALSGNVAALKAYRDNLDAAQSALLL